MLYHHINKATNYLWAVLASFLLVSLLESSSNPACQAYSTSSLASPSHCRLSSLSVILSSLKPPRPLGLPLDTLPLPLPLPRSRGGLFLSPSVLSIEGREGLPRLLPLPPTKSPNSRRPLPRDFDFSKSSSVCWKQKQDQFEHVPAFYTIFCEHTLIFTAMWPYPYMHGHVSKQIFWHTVHPRISCRGLIFKNEFLSWGLFEGASLFQGLAFSSKVDTKIIQLNKAIQKGYLANEIDWSIRISSSSSRKSRFFSLLASSQSK